MKERGILFSAPMVKALLEGRKTQTRRLFYKGPAPAGSTSIVYGRGYPKSCYAFEGDFDADGMPEACSKTSGCLAKIPCPYGAPGDRLWVRETHARNYFDDGRTAYRADFDKSKMFAHVPEPKWTPGIHMFRKDSRITLEVTKVRCEKLQAITLDDARAEGFAAYMQRVRLNGQLATAIIFDPLKWYATLWDQINAPKVPWSSDPWVWTVEFRRITP